MMASEAGSRPILPQTAPLNYSFVPQPQRPAEPVQRNYVFVDEHNRHKRLKVMRACDGCRRRKIKCDAATTNTWPCGACTRLKLTCVPPTVSYDSDAAGESTFEVQTPQQFRTVDHVQMYPSTIPAAPAPASLQPSDSLPNSYTQTFPYQPPSYLDLSTSQAPLVQFESVPPNSVPSTGYGYSNGHAFDDDYQHPAGDLAWNGTDVGTEVSTDNLTEAMGELSIDHTGVAPYITAQKKSLASTHAVEDYEADLPLPAHTSSDYTVRIPPEMFPSDQRAMKFFKYYFDNIHPYCPVINRAHFYDQWHTDRESISTLLLEAIFACASMALEGHQAGTKWLALASKHEDSFKDVARLSTVQAMIILLKARESVPKRGYYFRSWMTVVNSVYMCEDLEINDHLEKHQNGLGCGSPSHECATRQRIWNLLYVLEIMVGGPQGRHDFRVQADSCDFSASTLIPGFDDFEVQISRQFSYLMKTARNVKETNMMWHRLQKRKKDWGLDESFVRHNQDYVNWLQDLPRDLQVTLPSDGAEPWVASHFIAQLHCYHYLSIVMHHRPQIHFLSDAGDPAWRQHMTLCYTSAKNMCRIQEAIIHKFGLEALSCMQRGISFTIYSILTCTMVHLAAITAPDPELNNDAPDFFARHMRLLEQCVPHWDMPEMHMQINALREAFSADTSKPFALKPGFRQGSPPAHRSSQSASPPFHPEASFGSLHESTHSTTVQPSPPPGQVPRASFVQGMAHPMTPPISTTGSEPQTDSPVGQSLANMPAGSVIHGQQRTPSTSAGIPAHHQPWNPTRLFDQWEAAFQPTPPPQASQQSPPPLSDPANTSAAFDLRDPSTDSIAASFAGQQQPTSASFPPHANQVNAPGTLSPYQQPIAQPPHVSGYITPNQWKDLVASSFGDGGLKRRWDNAYGMDMTGGAGGVHKRAR